MDQLININQLEFLTQLGREQETVNILGTTFTFQTLTVDENTEAFETPSKENYIDDIAKFNAMRIEILSRAIVGINNIAIPEKMKGNVKKLLKRSQQAALNKLFESYQSLVSRQEKNISDAEAGIKPPGQIDRMAAVVPAPPATVLVPELAPEAPPAPPENSEKQPEEPEGPVNIALDSVNPSNLMGPNK